MRARRLTFILIAFYFVFLGGSAYYNLFYPVRFFHHGFVTLLMGLWYWRKLRGDGLPYTPLNPAIYAAVIAWVITAITSIDPRMAFENLWMIFIHLTIFFVLVDLMQRGRQRLIMETQFLLAALVLFISLLELASWYFGLGITPGTSIGWFDVIGPGAWFPLELPRLALAMNISTILAGYVAPLITLTVAWSLTARQRDYRRVLWILAIGLGIVLLFTASRGGWLSAVAGLITLAILRLSQQKQLNQLLSRRSILIGAAITGLAAAVLFIGSQSRSGGDVVRLDLYRSAVEMTLDNPLTGVGTGIYGRVYRDYRTVSINTRDKLVSAHNAYLNISAENGLFGLIVGLWIGVIVIRTWLHIWSEQTTEARKIRLEGTIAALIGFSVHNLVDVFTTTQVVSVFALLLAYSITGHRSVLDERPAGVRWAAAVGLIITAGFGVFLYQIDRAQLNYQNSILDKDNGLQLAYKAESIDPALNLYDLHIAYLLGQQAIDKPTAVHLEQAVEAYETALHLEPTWDTGWANLAALEEQRGNLEQATTYLITSRDINPINTSQAHLARLLEQLPTWKDNERIVYYYRAGMHFNVNLNNRLPISTFWQETPLRQKVLTRYTYQQRDIDYLGIDRVYRILRVQDPLRAQTLIPEEPRTAAEYWIAGEVALEQGNAGLAEQYFTEAIQRDRRNGDYYASRARARLANDPKAAERDLKLAQLLGTRHEYPNAIRAQIATDPEAIRLYLASALPPRPVPQEFAAVLYGGRMAIFDTYPTVQAIGPGHEVMQPWYTLAEHYQVNGLINDARRVYTAIIDYAPDEHKARQSLAALSG